MPWGHCCRAADGGHPRLSDTGLVKLFRLLRLARRLLDLESRRGVQRHAQRSLSHGRHAMSAPHPLNQAVIAQALHDLRNGQLRRCKAMGFGEEELDALKHPELVSMLVNATVSWCSVSVNRDVLKRLLSQVHDVEREIATVDRMLRLGASTEMVSRFYGLTHQEVALRRDILGLPKRKGRHPVLDEAQDTALWKRWKAGVTEQRGIALDDDMAMLGLTMDLAEDLDPADVGDLGGDTQLDRPGAGVGHGDRRRTPARWPRGAVGAVRRCAAELAPAAGTRQRRRRRRLPVQRQPPRKRAARAVPRSTPDAAGAQCLAGVPPAASTTTA